MKKWILVVLLSAGALAGPSLEMLDRQLLRDPENGSLLTRRASLHYRAGRLDLAIGDASRAIAARPNDPQAYLLRGFVYWQDQRLEAAAQDFWWAHHLKPGRVDSFVFYYLVSRHLGRPMQEKFVAFASGRQDPALLMLQGRILPSAYQSCVERMETDRAHLSEAVAQARFIIGHHYLLLGRKGPAGDYLKGLPSPLDFLWAQSSR